MPTLVAITTLSRLPVCLQPLADDRLGLAALVARDPARVDVGRVDQVEAGLDEGVEQLERGRLVGGPAEDVAAEGERPDLGAGLAEMARGIRHGYVLLICPSRKRQRRSDSRR